MSASRLENHIINLLTGRDVNEANQFIVTFLEYQESWSEIMALLKSSNESIKYFCSNLIYAKACNYWTQLNDDTIKVVVGILLSEVQSLSIINHIDKLVMERMVAAICALSFRYLDGVQLAVEFSYDVSSCRNIDKVKLGLRFLISIPLEFHSQDMNRGKKILLDEYFLHAVPKVFAHLQSIIKDHRDQGIICADDVLELTISAYASWIGFGQSLSSLFSQFNESFSFFITCLSSTNGLLVTKTCSLLSDIIRLQENPLISSSSGNRSIAVPVLTIAYAVINNLPSLQIYFTSETEETAFAITDFVTSFLESEMSTISDPKNDFRILELFAFLLNLTRYSNRRLASLTFEAWIRLGDVELESRSPYLRCDIFTELLSALVNQCMLPNNMASCDEVEGSDSCEDIEELRDTGNGLDEVLVIIFRMLNSQNKYFGMFLQCMTESQSASIPLSLSWQHFEVIFYFLSQTMSEIKESIFECNVECVVQFITFILEFVRVNAIEIFSFPLLHSSVCKIIGSLVILSEKVLDCSPYLCVALDFLFQSLNSKTAGRLASRAICTLCHSSSSLFLSANASEIPAIFQVVDALIGVMAKDSSSVKIEFILPVIEKVTRSIARLDPDTADIQLGKMLLPMVNSFDQQVCSVTPDVVKMNEFLKTVTCMFSLCDEFVSKRDNISPCFSQTLSFLFPRLLSLHDDHRFISSIDMQSNLFAFYGACISSASSMVGNSEYMAIVSLVIQSQYGHREVCSSALVCHSIIIESLISGSHSNASEIGKEMFQNSTVAIDNRVSASLMEGGTLECSTIDTALLNNYFKFVQVMLNNMPEVFVSSSVLPELSRIICNCMKECHEIEVLREFFSVVKSMFSQFVNLSQDPQKDVIISIFPALPNMMENIVSILIVPINFSTIIPSAIEVFYLMVQVCGVVFPENVLGWLNPVVNKFDIVLRGGHCAISNESITRGLLILSSQNYRKFKLLVNDLIRIQSSQVNCEVLLDYEEIMQ